MPTVKVFYVEEEDPKNKDKNKGSDEVTTEFSPSLKLTTKYETLNKDLEALKGDHNYTLSNNITIRNLQCDVLDLKKKLEEKKKKLRISQQGLSRYRARCKYLRSTVEKLKSNETKKKRKQTKENVGFHSLNILNSDSRTGKLKMGRRYTTTDRKFALALYHCSSKSYELLQKEFGLPTVRSLRKWITVKMEDANEQPVSDLVEVHHDETHNNEIHHNEIHQNEIQHNEIHHHEIHHSEIYTDEISSQIEFNEEPLMRIYKTESAE